MTDKSSPGNTTTAPLANVALALAALEKSMNRQAQLPGFVLFYGPSGWGKTKAAAYAANQHRAYYVQAKSTWTKKAFVLAILTEMGVAPARTVYEMSDQIAEQLVLSRRPLIIDEIDHVIDKNMVEIVRDIYEGSGAAILMISEENGPAKLKRWERFHGRILEFVAAEPASLDDAKHLRTQYCRRIQVADDLLAYVCEQARGSARRITVNLARIEEAAVAEGKRRADREWWGDRPLYTGEAPKRRLT